MEGRETLNDNGFNALGIKSKVLTVAPADLYDTGLFLVPATGPLPSAIPTTSTLVPLPPLSTIVNFHYTPEVECPFLWDSFPNYTSIDGTT